MSGTTYRGVGVSPLAGAALAPLCYLALMTAGVTVLSIIFSGMRDPSWMSRDPSGWFLGGHRTALDWGVGLFISVMPSANHTFQIIDWLSGTGRWRMWPMYWLMIALPVAAFFWTQVTHAGMGPLLAWGALAAGSALTVLGFPKSEQPGAAED